MKLRTVRGAARAGRPRCSRGRQRCCPALAARYRLFAVTNGTAATQRRRIAGADLARFFEQIFISEEVGAPKPERAYFEACFAAIPGFCRAEAVIVGDSLTSDIAGGVCAGIRTRLVQPGARAHAGRPARWTRNLRRFRSCPRCWKGCKEDKKERQGLRPAAFFPMFCSGFQDGLTICLAHRIVSWKLRWGAFRGLLICILRSLLLFHIGFGCPISRFLQFAFHRS